MYYLVKDYMELLFRRSNDKSRLPYLVNRLVSVAKCWVQVYGSSR